MQDAIIAMLKRQDEVNSLIANDWRVQGFPFHRAIWLECAELLESYPWKWWKDTKAPVDHDNVVLELVDIWHFVLSKELLSTRKGSEADLEKRSLNILSHYKAAEGEFAVSAENLLGLIELFVQILLKTGKPNLTMFFLICLKAEVSLPMLHAVYLGKACLNDFRTLNGYAEGTYQKNWNGEEDNTVMMRIICRFTPTDPDFETELLNQLAEAYEGVQQDSSTEPACDAFGIPLSFNQDCQESS